MRWTARSVGGCPATGGVTATELTAAKSGLQQAFDRDLSDDGNVLGLIHDGLYLDRKLAFWVAHIVRRRFFVAPGDPARSPSEPLRIVEIRTDPAGCPLVVKTGRLGRYERRRIERFASFATVERAAAAADGIEAELLAARYVDLRARLESFKAATQAALLW